MLHPARTVPRSRALALLAWLSFVLLGPGPALPALHFALVAHRVCVEHGELEHIDGDTELLEREVKAAGAAPAAGKALAPGRSGGDSHGHEPCGVGGGGGSVAALLALRGAAAAPFAPASAPPSGTDCAHHGIALLSYAPKLAPPAHA